MAVVTTKAITIANRDAVPAVINDGRVERGTLDSSIGSVGVGAADSATSYYPLMAIPSSAMVRALALTTPAGMSTLAANIGIFKNTRDSGGAALGTVAAAGSGTFFAAAQSLATAQDKVNVLNVAGNYPTDKREQPIWQAIGLASDPVTTFDIGLVITTANTGAAGRVGLEVHYCDNSN